jgi:hypothetical protein
MLPGVQYHLLRIIVFYLKRNESFDMWKDFNFMTLIEGLNSAWRKEYVANLLPKHYGVWNCLGAVVAGFNELSKLEELGELWLEPEKQECNTL